MLKNEVFKPNTHVLVETLEFDEPIEVLVNWDGEYEFNGWKFDKDDLDSEIMGATDNEGEPAFTVTCLIAILGDDNE